MTKTCEVMETFKQSRGVIIVRQTTSVLSVPLYSHVHCRQSCKTCRIVIATPLIKNALK